MSDVNGPGATGSPAPRGANWDDPARRPNDFDESQRRQRNALIGLAVASTIVLLIGGVAFLASRSGGTNDATLDSIPAPTIAPSTVADTTTTSTTTTSTSTTTTLPEPVDAVADAGPDLAVDAGGVATLQAVAVTEGAEDDEVMWRQTGGPDVTAGVGALGGRAVSFGAPDDVVTLEFELVVVSGTRAATAPEAVDALTVRVFEQADAAVFVDAERGDDAGDGSMESPVRSLVEASRRASGGADLYVRSIGTYNESEPIQLGTGSSLYGGFDENWNRDRAARIQINAAAVGIIVDGDGDRKISAVELTASDAEVGRRAIGVRVSDGETVIIEDSRIVSGRAGDGVSADDDGLAGASVGVLVIDTGEIRLERSTVNGGGGGNGGSSAGAQDRSTAESGDDGNGIEPGSGGADDGEGSQRPGGDGGSGASNGPGDDAPGELGGAGGEEQGDDGTAGRGGLGGAGGRGGNGGVGSFGADDAVPIGASGAIGDPGASGTGAGGGGGGASGFGVGLATGGGGGGGGAGARGSNGGLAGGGGGGSIGVWAVRVDRVVITESLVAAGRGGDGALGAAAGAAGDGGVGGAGVEGGEGGEGGEGVAVAGNGAGGGGGGAGGVGGVGGGGAGGPSYGMLTSDVGAVEIMATTIRGGGGGTGGDGGGGGAGGVDGADGSDRTGGVGGSAGAGDVAARGNGASGGSSFGWFDVDDAIQTFDGAEFIEGVAGAGGQGSTSGETGVEANANVDAG